MRLPSENMGRDSEQDVTNQQSTESNTVVRRDYLKQLGLLSGVGAIAGCTGSEDDEPDGSEQKQEDRDQASDGEAGERVPTIEIEYWSDSGYYTTVSENSLPIVQQNVEDALGVDVEISPVSITSQLDNMIHDKRTAHAGFGANSNAPSRLDPHEFTWRYNVCWAGNNNKANQPSYANCEHSQLAQQQSTAGTIEDRRELVNEAQSIMSEDIMMMTLFSHNEFSLYNKNEIEPDGLGNAGISTTSYRSIIQSSASTDRGKIMNVAPSFLRGKNHLIHDDTSFLAAWNHIVYSGLLEYNENYEMEPVLAKDEPETSDDGLQLTFELRDATFHNGDPITAEDVKWTYEFLNEYGGNYPKVSETPYESIEAIDEKTVQFNLQEPFTPLQTKVLPRWGVMPKQVWQDAGIEDSPRDPDLDQVVGSGPYRVTAYQQQQLATFEPWDDHPVFSPDSNLTWQAFQDTQSAVRAFKQNDINMLVGMPPGQADRTNEETDAAELVVKDGFMEFHIYPMMPFGPMKLRPFRKAFSYALDREAIVESAMYGRASPITHSTPFAEPHPWRPPEDMLTQIGELSASPEEARQILEEAGFTWDDNGRLRYPDDADLTPLWPQGEEPKDYPDEWPCVEDLCE